jgi:hypothetical protein
MKRGAVAVAALLLCGATHAVTIVGDAFTVEPFCRPGFCGFDYGPGEPKAVYLPFTDRGWGAQVTTPTPTYHDSIGWTGFAEFAVAGQTSAGSATLTFEQRGGLSDAPFSIHLGAYRQTEKAVERGALVPNGPQEGFFPGFAPPMTFDLGRFSPVEGGRYSYDVTDAFNAALGDGWLGFYLIADAAEVGKVYGATFDAFQVTTAPIPEPGTWALMLVGVAGVLARRRRATR